MSGVWQRAQVQFRAEIPASAGDAWDLLTDWAGILRWWQKPGPVEIVDVALVGTPDGLPRARRITAAGAPVALETLLKADPAARRIYYDLADGGIPFIRNYLATTTIDAAGDDACIMEFASTFDVAGSDDAAFARAIILAVYGAIAEGFTGYFARRRG
jgi:hypothetical protein